MTNTTAYLQTQKIQYWIWFYFWMLLLEGVLRKWILPQASDILLIIRDPIVLWIYFLAYKLNKFPNDRLTRITIFAGFLVFLGGLFNCIVRDQLLIVALFGIRTDFLHLFLIFLIPKVFKYSDVKAMGRMFLLTSLLMSILMIIQFLSPADAYINKTAGLESGLQIRSAMGKIRPPGTFTFISGPAFYYPIVMAFILHGILEKYIYPRWLLIASGLSSLMAISVSGSRTTVTSVSIVIASTLIIFFMNNRFIKRISLAIFLGVIVASILSQNTVFMEGIQVLTSRINEANSIEDSGGGFLGRIFRSFTEAFDAQKETPIFGYGLGLGTLVGAALSGNKGTYLLAENEWPRVVMESGFFLGSSYILTRILIILNLGFFSVKKIRFGNTLPILLLSASFPSMLNGQLSQSTILGFSVLGLGLCLASGERNLECQKADEDITL